MEHLWCNTAVNGRLVSRLESDNNIIREMRAGLMWYSLRSIRLSIFLRASRLLMSLNVTRQVWNWKKKTSGSKSQCPVWLCVDEWTSFKCGLCHMFSLKTPGCLNTVVTISYNYDLAINHSFYTNASLTPQIVPICFSKPERFPADRRATCVLHLTGFSEFHGPGHVC